MPTSATYKRRKRGLKERSTINQFHRKRDTANYVLRQGRKVVYIGHTNNPKRRLQEHIDSGKKFTSMTWSPRVSHKTAIQRERKNIESYKRSHSGKIPKYNKRLRARSLV